MWLAPTRVPNSQSSRSPADEAPRRGSVRVPGTAATCARDVCEYRGMTTPGSIVHVVLTQWRADAPGEALAELKAIIRRFQAEIPDVVSVVEGASVSTEGLEAEFEWALVVTFANKGARDGYLVHPTHLPVAELIGKWSERVVVFDVGA